jgi:hypothetical protein
MNEYIALELMRQRGTERRKEARTAQLARTLRLARRHRQTEDALVSAPVPDYVDGSFCPADDRVADDRVAGSTVAGSTVRARHESAAR